MNLAMLALELMAEQIAVLKMHLKDAREKARKLEYANSALKDVAEDYANRAVPNGSLYVVKSETYDKYGPRKANQIRTNDGRIWIDLVSYEREITRANYNWNHFTASQDELATVKATLEERTSSYPDVLRANDRLYADLTQAKAEITQLKARIMGGG